MSRRRPLGMGICDRCGLAFKHSTLRKTWEGLMVCPADYERKHPQLTPNKPPVGEPRRLKNARPDTPLPPVDLDAIDLENIFPRTTGHL